MKMTKRFVPGRRLLGPAMLLAALVLMISPSAGVQAEPANGSGPWVIVVLNSGGTVNGEDLPGALYTVDSATNTLYGPFLAGQLGPTGGGLFDVALTPDGRTALVSNFGGSTVFLVDTADPTDLQLLGSVKLDFFAEDIAITANGRYALVSNGGFSPRLASIDIGKRALVEVEDLRTNNANAVAVAPDGTVVVADYFSGKIHTLTVDSWGNLTFGQTYVLPEGQVNGEPVPLRPVNLGLAPDGRTVLVLATYSDHVPVYKIAERGVLSYVGLVEGLPAIWNANDLSWSGSQQSVAFNCQGTEAYVLTNGLIDPEGKEEPRSKISVLEINGPGNVSLREANAADIPDQGSSQLFGVDCLAVADDELFVSNPTISGGKGYLRVVNLTTYDVSTLNVSSAPGAVTAGVDARCNNPPAVPRPVSGVGGVLEPVDKAGVIGSLAAPYVVPASVLVGSAMTLLAGAWLALRRRR